MPSTNRIPSPPAQYSQTWAGQLVQSITQFMLTTADANSNTVLAQDTVGRVTTQVVLPFAGTFTYVPATMGLNVKITQAGNQTITLDGTGLPVGAIVTLLLVQDATGGRVTTWGGANIKWPAATAPTLNTTANKQNLVQWYWDGFFFCGTWSSVNL